MYTTIRHELPHARMAWPGTLVDQCLLSGTGYVNISNLVSIFSYEEYLFFVYFLAGLSVLATPFLLSPIYDF